jgi:hypothetical protein
MMVNMKIKEVYQWNKRNSPRRLNVLEHHAIDLRKLCFRDHFIKTE